MYIALTGGIGSGKSYVCRLLEERGISVYDCDKAAKRLMRSSPELQAQLSLVVGEDVFPDGRLDKALLSRFIVASEENVRRINEVVHPAVARDFIASEFQWLESAIFFESGFAGRVAFDYVVCVVAPLEVRLARIMARDGISREKAQEWIDRQMAQEEKMAKSDFVIENDGHSDLAPQIGRLLEDVGKQWKRNFKE